MNSYCKIIGWGMYIGVIYEFCYFVVYVNLCKVVVIFIDLGFIFFLIGYFV